MNEDLLDIIRCPISKAKLQLADQALLNRLNDAIERGELVDQVGNSIQKPIEAALVDEHGKHVYTVVESIPNMIADESILIDQLNERAKG